jgi:predicted Zn-dependent protease with MMP-like domain
MRHPLTVMARPSLAMTAEIVLDALTMTVRHNEPREFGSPPSLMEMEAIAYQEFERIPEELRSRCIGVAIRVEDFALDDILADMEIESPFDLMGLYQGIPLTEQSTLDVRHQPDIIFLYRRAILDYWCEGDDDLRAVVRHVLIHEIGHHFGFSDDDMERIEAVSGSQ